jgi:hypothetical protein
MAVLALGFGQSYPLRPVECRWWDNPSAPPGASHPILGIDVPPVCTPVAPATYDPDSVACKSAGLSDLRLLSEPLFIAHTKPRHEKVLAWEIGRLGFKYFLPMLRAARQCGRKKYIALEPALRQYLFIVGDRDVQDAVYNLPADRILKTIDVADDQQAKLRQELAWIDTALSINDFVEFCPYAVPGRTCVIKTGAYRGFSGIVVSRDETKSDKVSVMLQVTILRVGVEIEIDVLDLEPAD